MKYKFSIIVTVIVISLTWLTGCQKTEVGKIKNIEQIHEEEGIPVRVKEMQERSFSTFLN